MLNVMKRVFERVDTVALGADGEPVLLVRVTTRPPDESYAQEYLAEAFANFRTPGESPPYAMVAGLEEITLFRWEKNTLTEPILSLPTVDILSFYDPEFGHKQVFSYYLTTLIEAWLRDCAYHWKSETPPGYEQLRSTGLVECLENGTTIREGRIAA